MRDFASYPFMQPLDKHKFMLFDEIRQLPDDGFKQIMILIKKKAYSIIKEEDDSGKIFSKNTTRRNKSKLY